MGEQPVTVSITRHIKPGKQAEAEAWLKGFGAETAKFPGFMGIETIANADTLVTIFRFSSQEQLEKWQYSDVRQEWLRRGDSFTETRSDLQVVTGLEYWFTLPRTALIKPPPRHKMIVVTWLALTPLSAFLSPVLAALLTWLPGGVIGALLRTMIIAAVLLILMTYLVMPMMTRLFWRWLYPG